MGGPRDTDVDAGSGSENGRARSALRERLRVIIFGADTPAGKWFDVILLVTIVVSIGVVLLESVRGVRDRHGDLLLTLEWCFTALFTVEYLLRLWTVHRPARYARSFFGVVDLLAILPTYVSLLVPGSQSLIVIRAIRLLRVFRVFKLARYVGEGELLWQAMRASRQKITVFLVGVVSIVVIVGAVMYLIEGTESGFTSIPTSIYWAVVTMTTVGYGDIAPQTVPGKFIASCVMVIGYGIIAVPTGIVTAELHEAAMRARREVSTKACPACGQSGHAPDSKFCKDCGSSLTPPSEPDA